MSSTVDKYKNINDDNKGGFTLTNLDEMSNPIKIKRGYIRGVMNHADGREEVFETHVDGEIMNLIVNRASLLVSQLMKGETPGGVSYLAVGTGYGSGGTLQNPISPSITDTLLETELTRNAVSISYYDTAHAESDTIWQDMGGSIIRTNKLLISCTFTELQAVGALTEMGLFGGSGAASANGGNMINRKTFAVWNKPNNATLTWAWILVF